MISNPYIISIVIATVLGWSSWLVVVNKLSPFSTPELSLSLFYASLFIALSGTITLLIYYFKAWMSKSKNYGVYFNMSLRQGVLLSGMICTGIVFQRLKVLTWWDSLLLLAIVLLIEFYFMARD